MKKNNTNTVIDFQALSSRIIYEDNHLIVINKKAGEIVQGDKTGDMPLSECLKLFIKERDQKSGQVYIGVAHRIDRPVSGAILFAKTDKALGRINRMIQERVFHKTYWAIVKNKPTLAEGHLIHWLKKNEKQNKSYAFKQEQNGALKAELKYKYITSSENYHLLEIELLTGRHHQIRVQLSEIGCPIKGDLKYGAERSHDDGSIALHARYLDFIHPVKQEPIHITAPVPKDKLWQFFESQIQHNSGGFHSDASTTMTMND